MMSKSVVLGLAIALAAATIAIAQSVQGNDSAAMSILTQTVCSKQFKDVREQLEKDYGEIPVGSSETHMVYYNTEGKPVTIVGSGVFFLNPSSGTYSMVLRLKDESACVISTGTSFRPFGKEIPAEEYKQKNDVEKIEIKNGRYTST